MTDPAILADDQIVTSDPMASGSLRPENGSTFQTDLPVVNITIQLTNDEHISAPQLGKIDIDEEWSIHVAYYKVCIVCAAARESGVPCCTLALKNMLPPQKQ